ADRHEPQAYPGVPGRRLTACQAYPMARLPRSGSPWQTGKPRLPEPAAPAAATRVLYRPWWRGLRTGDGPESLYESPCTHGTTAGGCRSPTGRTTYALLSGAM